MTTQRQEAVDLAMKLREQLRSLPKADFRRKEDRELSDALHSLYEEMRPLMVQAQSKAMLEHRERGKKLDLICSMFPSR